MAEDKHKKFVRLLQAVKIAGIGKSAGEIKKRGNLGDPIFYYCNDGFAGIAEYEYERIEINNRGKEIIWKGKEYAYKYEDQSPRLFTASNCKSSEDDLFLFIEKGLYKKLRKQIKGFGFLDHRSEEETEFFLDTVLDYFEKQYTEIPRIVSYFIEQDQEGPPKMAELEEKLSAEEFLKAQKMLEKTLENKLLEKNLSTLEGMKDAQDLITHAKKYKISTERARKLLAEKINEYKKKMKKQSREAEKIKEGLLF